MRVPLMALRMRTVLLASLVAVSVCLTLSSLLVVRKILRDQIRTTLTADLQHSVATFQRLQAQRGAMLRSEARLLADLPSLRALMTTQDERTIQDGGTEFWKISGSDFFALTGRGANLIADYNRGPVLDSITVERQLQSCILTQQDRCYIFSNARLYEVSFQPLYFNTQNENSLLGFLAVGYALDQQVANEVSGVADAQVAFSANGTIISSTLSTHEQLGLATSAPQLLIEPVRQLDMHIGKEHNLAASVRLSGSTGFPVQMVVLKSFDQASRFLARLNRLLIALGMLIVLFASAVALFISSKVTQPLEALVAGVRALGEGDYQYGLSREGTLEVRQLSTAFERMRLRLHQTQQNLLEAERLATIGRMARSVSHDLRHHLSAMYANAEFLSSAAITDAERTELFQEVRVAVHGMTDLIDSLLIFSRTGQRVQPRYESLQVLMEHAIMLASLHPDARDVEIVQEWKSNVEVWVEAKELERAVYNLLINACQAAARSGAAPQVTITLAAEGDDLIRLDVADNGPGVPEAIRTTLFQPFVSEGKPNGAGLGLALVHHIAREHGGSVVLMESRDGLTVFRITLSRGALSAIAAKADSAQTLHIF